MHKTVELTVSEHWERFHGLEVAESEDEYEYMDMRWDVVRPHKRT